MMKKALLVFLLFTSVLGARLYEIKLSYDEGEITQTDFIVFEGRLPEDGGSASMYYAVGDGFRKPFAFPILVSEGRELRVLEKAEYSLILPAEDFDSSSEVYIEDWEGVRVLTLDKPVQPKVFEKSIHEHESEGSSGLGMSDGMRDEMRWMELIKWIIQIITTQVRIILE